MLSRVLGFACALSGTAGWLALAQTPPPGDAARAQRPRYHTAVDLVSLNVTVLDAHDRPVSGIARESFAVYEDGVQQDVAYFQSSDVPLDLALLIDISTSMSDKLPSVREAATGFARILRPSDRGAVIAFNNRVAVRQPFTTDPTAIARAIASARPVGNTALYDTIYIALRELVRDAARANVRPAPGDTWPDVGGAGRMRRQAIVVLTDGHDTTSLVTFDALLEEARQAGVTIYTMCMYADYGFMPWWTTAERVWPARIDFSMKQLARETGALSFLLRNESELVGAYTRVAEELTHQYMLGYVSKNASTYGAFRRIVVRLVDRPDARPRARLGYVARAGDGAASSNRSRP